MGIVLPCTHDTMPARTQECTFLKHFSADSMYFCLLMGQRRCKTNQQSPVVTVIPGAQKAERALAFTLHSTPKTKLQTWPSQPMSRREVSERKGQKCELLESDCTGSNTGSTTASEMVLNLSVTWFPHR